MSDHQSSGGLVAAPPGLGTGATGLRRLALVAVVLLVASLGAVGRAEAFGSSKPPTSLPSVSAGGYMTCALRADKVATCWGSNDGSGNEGPGQADAPSGVSFSEVNAGYSHACGLREDSVTAANDDTAVCWGSTNAGTPPAGMKFSHVVAGYVFSCGLRSDSVAANDKTAVCWGTNDAGQTTIPPGAVKFAQLTVGIRHTCGLRESDSKVQCWGSDLYGQSSTAPTYALSEINSGNFDICGIKTSDSSLVCWGRNAAGQATTPSGAFTQVSVGFQHACARSTATSGDNVSCWGRNTEGQSTAPSGHFKEVSAGTFHSCGARTSDNAVICWGNNAAGRVAPIMTSLAPVPLATAVEYNHRFTTSFMTPVTWTISGAPSWLTLNQTGPAQVIRFGATSATWAQTAELTGTPPLGSAGASYPITVSATNDLVTVSETFTLTVAS